MLRRARAGGLFLNGDELRPESDADYLAAMEWWCEQKDVDTAAGRIPESFRPMFEAWHDRNVRRFGEPKTSGDDCHETAAVQEEYLRAAGFRDVRVAWSEQLWGILFGRKLTDCGALLDLREQLQQRDRVDRLHQVHVEAGLLRLAAIFFLAPAGDGDEDCRLAVGKLADAAGDVVAAEPRQADVQAAPRRA